MEYSYYKSNENQQSGGRQARKADPGGERFECDAKQPFAQICQPKPGGKYRAQESCVNDCTARYVNHHLIQSGLKFETYKFENMIYELMEKNLKVYVKGGTTLGLEVLKMINPADLKKHFNQFLELGLIRDWDFAVYTKNPINEECHQEMDTLAKKFKMKSRAKTFILYQLGRPIMIDDNALFEIAVLCNDFQTLSCMELPMTTMKIKATRKNIKAIFILANAFYLHHTKGEEIDLDMVKHMIELIEIKVYPYRQGLYLYNDLDKGSLSETMIKFIVQFAEKKGNKFLSQFLVTHIQEPNRMFYRLLVKNCPKSDKIRKFVGEIGKKVPGWLLDVKYILKIVEEFVDKLAKEFVTIYRDPTYVIEPNSTPIHCCDDVETIPESNYPDLDRVSKFIDGINLNRIYLEQERMNEQGFELVKKLFSPLYNLMKDDIDNMPPNNQLVKLLLFLREIKLL